MKVAFFVHFILHNSAYLLIKDLIVIFCHFEHCWTVALVNILFVYLKFMVAVICLFWPVFSSHCNFPLRFFSAVARVFFLVYVQIGLLLKDGYWFNFIYATHESCDGLILFSVLLLLVPVMTLILDTGKVPEKCFLYMYILWVSLLSQWVWCRSPSSKIMVAV